MLCCKYLLFESKTIIDIISLAISLSNKYVKFEIDRTNLPKSLYFTDFHGNDYRVASPPNLYLLIKEQFSKVEIERTILRAKYFTTISLKIIYLIKCIDEIIWPKALHWKKDRN